MPDPATQKTEIVRTVESLCDKWLHSSREEEREELARQVGVCVSVFPWLWETLHPLQLPGVRESSPEPCCCIVTPLPREPEAVRVGTVRLTANIPSAHASSASTSSPPPDCTTWRTEMPDAIDFGEEERQQVLRVYREEELRWKPWLISEEELSPAAPPRTGRPLSPPRSDYLSPASYLARMWSEDEEPVAMENQVLSTAASKRKRRSRRRRASLRPVLPSTEQHEDAVEGIDFNLEERQRAACAPPTLASPASAKLQEAPAPTSTGSTAKKKRRSHRCHTAQHSEVSETVLSPQVTSEWKACEVNTDLARDMASNELLTKPQSRDSSSQSITNNSLNPAGTSESTHRLKETSTASHVNSGREVFPFVSLTMSAAPTKSELPMANVFLPESALLLHQSLNEGNESITQSLVKVMSGNHVLNKGSAVPELTGSQATPFFNGPTGVLVSEPDLKKCVFPPLGPSAATVSKDNAEVANHELEGDMTSDPVFPATLVFNELKTVNADHELMLSRQDANITADHGDLDCVMPQHEFCFSQGNKQGDFELFCSSTITSNREREAEIRVNVTPFSPVSVNSSLDKILLSNTVNGSSTVLPVSVSPHNTVVTLKLRIASGIGSSKHVCPTYHSPATNMPLVRSIPEYFMFVQEPHHNGLSLVFVGQVVILVFRMAEPAPLSLTLPLIRSNQLMLTPPVTTETEPFAFKPIKTDTDSVNQKNAGSELVVINTAHFMDSCAKIVSTMDCFSPALSLCGIMPQLPVFPQPLPQLAAQLPAHMAALLPVQPGASITVHPASAAGCPGVPTRRPAASTPLHIMSAGGPEEPVQPPASSAGGPEEPLPASSAGGSGEPSQHILIFCFCVSLAWSFQATSTTVQSLAVFWAISWTSLPSARSAA
ncbi:acyl-CoA dehydrogenase [Sarotherodon galilaeus]